MGYVSTPSFGDLNGDGKLDLISGDYYGYFHYFENTGTTSAPAFGLTASINPFALTNVGTYSKPSFVDFDGDGDMDLLSGESNGDFYYFKNTGSPIAPAFAAASTNPFALTNVSSDFTAPSFVDLDDDGDMDLLSGDGRGRFNYFENSPAEDGAIVIEEAFSTPGDANPPAALPVAVKLVTTSPDSVAGAQFDIDLSRVDNAVFDSYVLVTTPAVGFQVQANYRGQGQDTLRVLVFTTTVAGIPPGAQPVVIAHLKFNPSPIVGSSDSLHIFPNSISVTDRDGKLLGFDGNDGALYVTTLSLDLNGDAETDIRDIVLFVAELLTRSGYVKPTDVRSKPFQIRDGNDSETLDVGDAIAMVNKILNLNLPVSKAVAGGAPAGVSFGALTSLADGRVAVPVIIEGAGISGLQASFTFDPAKVQIGAPVSPGGELLLDSQTKDGVLNVIAISLSAQGLSAAGPSVFYLPVIFLAEDGIISLSALSLADRGANLVSLNPGVVGQTISKQGAAPKSFSLGGARPNPFNPSATIAYEVPVQAKVTLTVYNLLGQEVVTLVNQVQAAGRYEVTWNALNAQGRSVSSGVYLYRMTTNKGYSETKRMTLLK